MKEKDVMIYVAIVLVFAVIALGFFAYGVFQESKYTGKFVESGLGNAPASLILIAIIVIILLVFVYVFYNKKKKPRRKKQN